MSDPTQRHHDQKAGAPAPDWLLSNDRHEDDPHPDLLDPTPAESASPAPAGTDEDLRLQAGLGADFSDDTSDIIGVEHVADENDSFPLDSTDTGSAIPHHGEAVSEEDEVEPVTPAANFEADTHATYPEPVAYPLLADEGEPSSDPGAPQDVLARRDLPAEPAPRREYDLSRLHPQDRTEPAPAAVPEEASNPWESESLETTSVQRQSLLSPEVEEETVVAPATTTTAWKPVESPQQPSDNALFEESSVVPDLPSRGSARLWSFILTLLLIPVAWYLLSDAAARLTLAEGNAFETGVINPAALLELGGGVVIVIIILAYLVRSSLGALLWGLVLAGFGATFLAIPAMVKDFLRPIQEWLSNWNAFGGNVAHHIEVTGFTGILFTSGVLLFSVGLIAILARRDGRRDEQIRAQIERLAPGTFSRRRKRR